MIVDYAGIALSSFFGSGASGHINRTRATHEDEQKHGRLPDENYWHHAWMTIGVHRAHQRTSCDEATWSDESRGTATNHQTGNTQ